MLLFSLINRAYFNQNFNQNLPKISSLLKRYNFMWKICKINKIIRTFTGNPITGSFLSSKVNLKSDHGSHRR